MPRYRLVLEYDGSDFRGWQNQAPGERTVQGTLEGVLAKLTGQAVSLTGAGRTDAGVHAEGQVASFVLPEEGFPVERLVPGLNSNLPDDLAVRSAEIVPNAFDPRRDARSKHYRYEIWNGPVRSPLRRRRMACVPERLDRGAMARAARAFEGSHDFASLQSTGSSVKTTKRTILRCELAGEGHHLRLDIEGTGFLRHMVRTLAGTLVEVGQGRRSAESIPELLAAADRTRAGPTAPACGLTLVAVRYGA